MFPRVVCALEIFESMGFLLWQLSVTHSHGVLPCKIVWYTQAKNLVISVQICWALCFIAYCSPRILEVQLLVMSTTVRSLTLVYFIQYDWHTLVWKDFHFRCVVWELPPKQSHIADRAHICLYLSRIFVRPWVFPQGSQGYFHIFTSVSSLFMAGTFLFLHSSCLVFINSENFFSQPPFNYIHWNFLFQFYSYFYFLTFDSFSFNWVNLPIGIAYV